MPKKDEMQNPHGYTGWGANGRDRGPMKEMGYEERIISGPKPDSSYEPRMVRPEYGPHHGGPSGLPNKSRGTKLR